MKKVKVYIERGRDGYSAYMDDTPLDYSCVGNGKTVKETIADFEVAYEEMKKCYEKLGEEFEPVEFEFCYDSVSFLQSLTDVFTLSGLSKITGVNEKQLGHYVQGISKPRASTAQKIQKGVLNFAKDLTSVHLL